MREFDAWGISMLLHHIGEGRDFARKMIAEGSRDELITRDALDSIFGATLVLAEYHAKESALTSTFDRVSDNGQFRMAFKTGNITWQQMESELLVLRQCIENDLEKHTFVFITPQKAAALAELPKKWEAIWTKFPETKADTRSAAECYALEQDIGCVFHMMRVAEHGLRAVAKKVGVKLKDKGRAQPIEYATWDKVIAGINGEIAKARSLPQGPRKNRKLQFYSDAAENCTYIRDLWRNETSHTRKRYNDAEALGVMNRVSDFMQLLAIGI